MAWLLSIDPSVVSTCSTVLTVLAVAFLLYFTYCIFFRAGKNDPPGPIGLPFLGNVLSLLVTRRQQHEVINDWSHKYGPIFAFKMLGTRVYILSDPGLVSEAFHQSADINDKASMHIADEFTGRPHNGEYNMHVIPHTHKL